MNQYQFLYWRNDPQCSNDLISLIKAKTLRGACGKFLRNRKGNQANLWIDYEVFDTTNCVYLDISEINSIKDYVR